MSEGNAGRLAYKVFRVMEEPENYCRSIIFEDLASRQFEWKGYSCFGGLPDEAERQMIDEDDIWSVLNNVKNAQLVSQHGLVFVSGADSLDMALSDGRAKREEAFEHSREIYERPSSSKKDAVAKSGASTTPQSELVATLENESRRAISKREIDRRRKEVWNLAKAKDLRWKPVAPTVDGSSCYVLTVDGSEEFLVGPSGIELRDRR
jgi:hypothetical protein